MKGSALQGHGDAEIHQSETGGLARYPLGEGIPHGVNKSREKNQRDNGKTHDKVVSSSIRTRRILRWLLSLTREAGLGVRIHHRIDLRFASRSLDFENTEDLWCSSECTPPCQGGGRGFKSRQVRSTPARVTRRSSSSVGRARA